MTTPLRVANSEQLHLCHMDAHFLVFCFSLSKCTSDAESDQKVEVQLWNWTNPPCSVDRKDKSEIQLSVKHVSKSELRNVWLPALFMMHPWQALNNLSKLKSSEVKYTGIPQSHTSDSVSIIGPSKAAPRQTGRLKQALVSQGFAVAAAPQAPGI